MSLFPINEIDAWTTIEMNNYLYMENIAIHIGNDKLQ